MLRGPEKILVIQLKRAGDTIVTTPVLPVLRERFPQTHIDFLTEKPFATLLDGNPALNGILLYDKNNVFSTLKRVREGCYDWVIDFQCSPRSAMVALTSGACVRAGYKVPFWGMVYNVNVRRPGGEQSVVEGKFTLIDKLLNAHPARPERRIFLSEAERAWGKKVLPKPDTIGVVPTHRHLTRRWTKEGFAAVSRALLAEGKAVLLFWGPGEEDYVQSVAKLAPGAQLIPKTNFREMASILGACRLVITNDNGPMHLAVAAGAPTLTVYGPTDPISWNPGGPRHKVVQLEGLSCLGCNMNECPFAHECMTDLSHEIVLAKAHEMLKAQVVSA